MTKPKIKLWKLKKEECHTEFSKEAETGSG